MPTQANETIPPDENEIYPQFTASERPVKKWDRIAFDVWTILFLFIIAYTLLYYVIMQY